jgi:hypothetical protein
VKIAEYGFGATRPASRVPTDRNAETLHPYWPLCS